MFSVGGVERVLVLRLVVVEKCGVANSFLCVAFHCFQRVLFVGVVSVLFL